MTPAQAQTLEPGQRVTIRDRNGNTLRGKYMHANGHYLMVLLDGQPMAIHYTPDMVELDHDQD
ncbi:hypothetical protein [Magnetococcus sp. PR-3]|uniref:hypothetical protein n=1 Tax=Magnetococcus sp. PR-3 TaxID=3120355 RepID=UPI002FCDE30A